MFVWLRNYLLAYTMRIAQYRKRSFVGVGVVWLLCLSMGFFLTKSGGDRTLALQLMACMIVPLLAGIQGLYVGMSGIRALLMRKYREGAIRLGIVVLLFSTISLLLTYFPWLLQRG